MKIRKLSPISVRVSILLVSISAITAGSWIYSRQLLSLGQPAAFYPTGIPWLQSQAACEATGRIWQDETCWDTEHDPTF